ncbi:hypothetical protein EOM57_04370 [Candidatus Saccharibacteria bacterium]|nr:hypothetical protein [Candidatus Saccharibacteria bacterium]
MAIYATPDPKNGGEHVRDKWEVIRAIENDHEDAIRRERFFALNDPTGKLGLFASSRVSQAETVDGLVSTALKPNFGHAISQVNEWPKLIEKFTELKDSANSMGERLKIALMPEYFRYIGLVELALTKNPDDEDSINQINSEYLDLLKWYEDQGRPLEILQPSITNTYITYRPPVITEIQDGLVIVSHNQRVARGNVPALSGETAHIQLIRSEVYGIPAKLIEAFTIRFGADCFENDDNPKMSEAVELYERFFSSKEGQKLIRPRIRLSYLVEVHDK